MSAIDFESEVVSALHDLRDYIDRRDREIDERLEDQKTTMLNASRNIERVATVHFDAAKRLARQSIIKFSESTGHHAVNCLNSPNGSTSDFESEKPFEPR